MWRALALLLVPTLALGQAYIPGSGSGGSSSGNVNTNPTYATQAATTYYVDSTGSDSNACMASGTSACLTIGKVISILPKHVNHFVTINVGAGTFATATTIDGFIFGSGGRITIAGTMAEVTGLTGQSNGTFTSATAGSLTSGTFATATMTSGTWATNELRNYTVRIDTGTGAGTYRAVHSNTDTVITVPGAWSGTPSTSTFTIVQPSTLISASTGFTLRGNLGGGNSIANPAIQFQFLKFTGTNGMVQEDNAVVGMTAVTSTGILKTTGAKSGSELFLQDSIGMNLGNVTWVAMQRGGRIRADRCIATYPGSGTMFNLVGGSMNATLQSVAQWGGALGVSLGPASYAVVEGSKFNRNGLSLGDSSGIILQTSGTNITGSDGAVATLELGGSDFSLMAWGVRAYAPSYIRMFGVVSSSGTTVDLQLLGGAQAKVASTVTLNTVSMDNESVTLATIRAPVAGKRFFRNSRGSTVFE